MIPRFLVLAALITVAACTSTTTSPTSSAPFSSTDLVVGTGTTASVGNRVTVSYTGWLYDSMQTTGKGSQFDSNPSFTFTLGSGSVIKGWEQGVVGMKVGGQRRLVIPPELAYGNLSPSSKVPANATLVFDISLLSVG